MREKQLDVLACPACRGELRPEAGAEPEESEGEIAEGELVCAGCGARHPIVNGIPRFVPAKNYAASFGYQWGQYVETQFDSYTGLTLSKERFFRTTDWPERMDGELLLEAGCGAGRYTQIALAAGATVVAFDFSNGVEANARINGPHERLVLAQGDIFSPPVREGLFDRVYCVGVIQHTPDPERAFRSLVRFVKPGGAIAIDVYRKEGPGKWLGSYRRLRWLTRTMRPETVHRLSQRYVDAVWPTVKWLWAHGRWGQRIARWVFLAKDRFWRKGHPASDELQKEWLVLHFVDQLCAWHDKPQTARAVQRWFESEGLEQIEVFRGGNGLVGRARRPDRPGAR